MIENFKDKLTEKIWNGEKTRLNSVLQQKTLLKLRYIHFGNGIERFVYAAGQSIGSVARQQKKSVFNSSGQAVSNLFYVDRF